jgi:large subunit ribosomal protein L25
MKEIVLEAEKREITTRGAMVAVRKQGRVPGVAYGDNETTITLSVDAKALDAAIHTERGRNALINLKIGGNSHAVIVKEIQRHPISRVFRHVDFYRVSLKKKIETNVPIHAKGEAPGVKLGGGILEFVTREIRVKCLPTEIPAAIDVDISALQLNQGIKGKDLALPAGVELLNDPEGVILHVVLVHVVEETPAAGAAAVPGAEAAAEPEVIKKGKVEEGEEGAAPAAGDKKAAPAAAKPEAKKPEGK